MSLKGVRASLVAQVVKNLPIPQEPLIRFLGREDLLEKGRLPTPVFLGFPGGSDSKQSACNAEDASLISRLGRSPGKGNGSEKNTPVFLPGEFHRQGSLVGYSPRGHKELDMTE